MDLNAMKSIVVGMGNDVFDMLGLISSGFMENKVSYLNDAMKKEDRINEAEKNITKEILALSKDAKAVSSRSELVKLAQMAETFERMGDEAASIVERIEIKITERLLFSELGVEQFNEVYNTMRKSVEMMLQFMKEQSAGLKDRIIDNGFHVKELVEKYRREHTERLVKGLCTPMSANMYFDMLDFTGNLARHASTVVKL